MTPSEAQKKLKKILGPKFGYRDHGTRTSPEQRELASEAWKAATVKVDAAKSAMEQKRADLLSDPEYRRLVEAYKSENAQRDSTRSLGGYRITVGVTNSIFFEVKAQGDNWADVVRKLERAK